MSLSLAYGITVSHHVALPSILILGAHLSPYHPSLISHIALPPSPFCIADIPIMHGWQQLCRVAYGHHILHHLQYFYCITVSHDDAIPLVIKLFCTVNHNITLLYILILCCWQFPYCVRYQTHTAVLAYICCVSLSPLLYHCQSSSFGIPMGLPGEVGFVFFLNPVGCRRCRCRKEFFWFLQWKIHRHQRRRRKNI